MHAERLTHLTERTIGEVLAVVDAASEVDRVRPLSEHVYLQLRHGNDESQHLIARSDDGRLLGYAHLDVTDPVDGPIAELVVAPEHRGQGVATRLVEALVAASPDGRMRLWAHGEHPGAAVLAARLGFERARSLWQMRRSLQAPLPVAPLPPGVAVRTFRPGADEPAWLEVNARAFATHPEQGRWTMTDLLHREREPWFDPAGFFLAERAGRLVGFHWTKVHDSRTGSGHAYEPIGEVYVVGVDPAAQGTGLGRALTVVGLEHLRDRGLTQVMLYVDESNTAAIRVYEGLGFARWDSDVTYRRRLPADAAP